jgi:hypothetical protein
MPVRPNFSLIQNFMAYIKVIKIKKEGGREDLI